MILAPAFECFQVEFFSIIMLVFACIGIIRGFLAPGVRVIAKPPLTEKVNLKKIQSFIEYRFIWLTNLKFVNK